MDPVGSVHLLDEPPCNTIRLVQQVFQDALGSSERHQVKELTSHMEAKLTRKGHYAIIYYEGDTVGLMPGPLPEVLEAMQQDGVQEVLLVLSGLRFLSPAGVKAIRESYEKAKSREVNMGIAAPPPTVRKMLKLSGLAQDVPIYYSQEEALTKLDLIDYETSARAEMTDRLLICQKDLPIAGELRKAFKAHHLKPQYRLVPVRDLKRAFEILLEEKIDCILVDAKLPVFQLSSFIEQVETDERLPRIPVLVVATDDQMEAADLLIRNGAQEIIRYPFQPVEVVVRLQTLICHVKDNRPYVPPRQVSQPRGWRA